MSNAVSAQNTQWKISSTVSGISPTTFYDIDEVKTFSPDGSRPEIDVSNLDSTAREYRLGLQDFGTFTLDMNCVFDSQGQMKLDEALASPDPWAFEVHYPDGTVDHFDGLVKSFPRPKGGVDQVLERTAQIRCTGTIITT